jgi:hypothetical protein
MRCGTLGYDRPTEICGVVPLPKLSEGAPAVVRSGRRLGTRSKSITVARVAELSHCHSTLGRQYTPPPSSRTVGRLAGHSMNCPMC